MPSRSTAAGWKVVKRDQSPHRLVGVPCRVKAEVRDQALDEVNLVTVERACAPQARSRRGVVGWRAEAREVRSREE